MVNIMPQTALCSPEQAQVRIKKAIRTLYIHCPFWAVLLDKVRIVYTEKVPTACVDFLNDTIGFNLSFLKTLTDPEVAFVLCHEVGHIAFLHYDRRKWREPEKYNVAADLGLNPIIRAAFGGSMPSTALYDPKYEGKSVEAIYEDLPEGGCEGGGTLVIQGDAGDTDLSKDIEAILKGEVPDPSEDGEGKSSTEDRPKVNWSSQVTKALTHAKMCGSVSSDFERSVRGMAESYVDWASVLRQKLSQHLSRDYRDDFTYSPPNRRYVYLDLILPSMVGRKSPTVAYSIDTSASMTEDEVSQGVMELENIRRMFGAKLYAMSCDYSVTAAQWVEPHEPMPKLMGGGGTSFTPIFEHLEKEHIDVDVVVVFTDGYGDFPVSTEYDTIWIITSEVVPPFGEIVHVRIPDRTR